MTYGLSGTFRAVPGSRDALAEHLLEAARLVGELPGCLLYLVATTDEPDEVAVVEVWSDEAAHDASLQDERVRALITQARPTIAGIAHRSRLTVLGGTGLG